jgi:RNA polymerase sigma factor (sigma-70 family)
VLRSRAARGDATAFAAVYERHHQALYRYCRSILRHEEDAQDALQNTFTRAFAALQDERRDFELRPWLFRIAHNEAITILRRRRDTSELGDLPGEDTEMEERVSEREELRVLRHDLADLPDRQRSALVLRELNGLSHAEIGTVLDLTPAAVKQAIFEARTALFSCREGREMACHDVRRMLSDGDGRVLRGRGVRAHLRSCPDCRRFKSDLEHRPAALKMLAPPLPTAGAAALLSQLLGGPTAVKLLACVAIAGSGTTIAAVEMHDTPKPQRTEAAEARPPAKREAVRVLAVTKSVPPRSAPAPTTEPRRTRTRAGDPSPRARSRRAPKPAPAKTTKRPKAVPPGQAKRMAAKPTPPGQAKRALKPQKPVKTPRPVKTVKPAKTPKPEKATPPGQIKKESAPAAADEKPLNKGQAKKQAG